MKRERTALSLRKTAIALFVTAGMVLTVASCKKDNDSDNTISSDEMAVAVDQSVSSSSGGLVQQTISAATVVNIANSARMGAKFADQCGVQHDTTVTGSSSDTATIVTWSYAFNWGWLLTCTEQVPSVFTFNYKGHAIYDGPRMSSDDSAKATITVSALSGDSSYYRINQTYTRHGSQKSKIGEKHSFTSLITITATNLLVNKSTLKILSGTATVNISGEGSGGKSFSRSGTITFSGNESASLVLNGDKYTVSWIK